MTYGDGVSDVNISATIDFHTKHGKAVTVTAVQPMLDLGGLNVEVPPFASSRKSER